MVKIIDLHFQHQSGAIAAFLVETMAGPVLLETGPHSTLSALEAGLQKLGYQITDIKHVFITHIHLDHAGAAWVFAKHGATIYLHPIGLPHLQNPEKLMTSARRIYLDQMDSLWGDMQPIPAGQLRAMEDKEKVVIGGVGFRALHTPGHAIHHIVWETQGMAFTGDVAGVKIGGAGPVMPPCPPPDINVEDWVKSLAYLRSKRFKSIFLTHFGEVKQPKKHFIELEARLVNWANWIRPYWEVSRPMEVVVPLFREYVNQQLKTMNISEEDMRRYELANPAEMSVAGLYRYWTKKYKPA
jgi:glyoxylase-like metal-dependent hydrolase (beta-lactamase superfamily II)